MPLFIYFHWPAWQNLYLYKKIFLIEHPAERVVKIYWSIEGWKFDIDGLIPIFLVWNGYPFYFFLETGDNSTLNSWINLDSSSKIITILPTTFILINFRPWLFHRHNIKWEGELILFILLNDLNFMSFCEEFKTIFCLTVRTLPNPYLWIDQ